MKSKKKLLILALGVLAASAPKANSCIIGSDIGCTSEKENMNCTDRYGNPIYCDNNGMNDVGGSGQSCQPAPESGDGCMACNGPFGLTIDCPAEPQCTTSRIGDQICTYCSNTAPSCVPVSSPFPPPPSPIDSLTSAANQLGLGGRNPSNSRGSKTSQTVLGTPIPSTALQGAMVSPRDIATSAMVILTRQGGMMSDAIRQAINQSPTTSGMSGGALYNLATSVQDLLQQMGFSGGNWPAK